MDKDEEHDHSPEQIVKWIEQAEALYNAVGQQDADRAFEENHDLIEGFIHLANVIAPAILLSQGKAAIQLVLAVYNLGREAGSKSAKCGDVMVDERKLNDLLNGIEINL